MLGLAAAALVLVPSVKAVTRRAVVMRAGEPRELVLATYRVFDGEATEIGLGRGAGETLHEYRERLLTRVTFTNGHVERLTGTASRAAYSSRDIGESEAHEAVEAARTAMREMRRQTGLLKRVAGAYRPRL
jgi:hypothetical protein